MAFQPDRKKSKFKNFQSDRKNSEFKNFQSYRKKSKFKTFQSDRKQIKIPKLSKTSSKLYKLHFSQTFTALKITRYFPKTFIARLSKSFGVLCPVHQYGNIRANSKTDENLFKEQTKASPHLLHHLRPSRPLLSVAGGLGRGNGWRGRGAESVARQQQQPQSGQP